MKQFKGKAIYNPSGKAGEYSYWACNFYVGCSNGCTYCYCKKGILKSVMGMDEPQLKKCFKDENDAFNIFQNEMIKNIDELRIHGLFFTFTSDPMLKETIGLTWRSVVQCVLNDIPVKILTKRADFIDSEILGLEYFTKKNMVAFGFTLTGHDELEQKASTNVQRIIAMKRLKEMGFKTFCSVEPIVDFESSYKMIAETLTFCDLYKIGIESGKKYNHNEMGLFVYKVIQLVEKSGAKIYFKDSITKFIPNIKNACVVGRDYNIFN
jgi:DNA repair photolyase